MTRASELIAKAWQARREGRLEDAERDLLRAIEVSREGGSRADRVRALGALAHVARDLEQGERALELSEEAVELSRQEGEPLLLAHTVRHLGDLHREADRPAEAERCYREALGLYRAAPDPPPLDFANALRPAAILKEAAGDASEARRLWTEARRLYEAAGVRQGLEECDGRLAALGS